MQIIETFDDKINFLHKIFTQRFGCQFFVDVDELQNCKVISVFINEKRKSCLKFEAIVFAYIKEFLGDDYDIYQIIKRKDKKIMIFYPSRFCY